LLNQLLEDGETSIIKMDDEGNCHFNGAFRNSEALDLALNKLRVGSYSNLVEKEKETILGIYEEIFDHQSFTGRSGTFYGYEGLGSIYWHMVSKLLLATQECYFKAIDEGAELSIVGQLKDHYYEIKAGIGLYKSPDIYGAFPTDAYSHTPANAGVKQPGLTGQVKEDFISRIMELGLLIQDGAIIFNTSLLNREEILTDNAEFEYYSLVGDHQKISLGQNQLAFTYCQVPIIYTTSKDNKILITFENGNIETIDGHNIGKEYSDQLFKRSGTILRVDVYLRDIKTNK